jgi:hypothetical protein
VRHNLKFNFRNATDDVDVDARGPGWSISRRDDDDDSGIGDVERGVNGDDDDAPDER